MRDRTGVRVEEKYKLRLLASPHAPPQQFPTVFPTTKISHPTTGYTTVIPCLQQTHRVAYRSGHSRPPPLRPRILSNVSSMEGEDDQGTYCFGVRMEDSFPSSPNSVTKTRFRNKILRTLFLSHLATDLRMQESHLHRLPSPRRLPEFAVELVPGDGEECEPPMGHKRVAPRGRRARSASPEVPGRTSRTPLRPGPANSSDSGSRTSLLRHSRLTHQRVHVTQFQTQLCTQTNPRTSNSPHSFPNSKLETPPPGFKPSAHWGGNQEKRVGSTRRLSITAPQAAPHPRPCVRVTPRNPTLPPTSQLDQQDLIPSPLTYSPTPPPQKKWRERSEEETGETWRLQTLDSPQNACWVLSMAQPPPQHPGTKGWGLR